LRGLVFRGNSFSEVIDYPDITPGPNQVLLKMRSSGLCGSDFTKYRSDSPLIYKGELIRPGHEPCGEIVDIGKNVIGLSIGDRIVQHHYEGCKKCNYCKTGWQQLCQVDDKKEYYGGSMHGGHGDYMIAHKSTCVKLPKKLPFEIGAYLACGASTAYHALKKLSISDTEIVAVFGQGPVGLAATMFGKEMGAKVIAIDISKERLDLAKKAGAWQLVDASSGDTQTQIRDITNGLGADSSIEAVGQNNTRIEAVESTRIFGKTCLVGEGGVVTYKPTEHIIHKHLTIFGSWTFSTSGLEESANFTAKKNVPLDSLITYRSNIENAPEAYKKFSKGYAGKFVINWD
tara:strand:- start:26947 stop:27978 length:1032 start_codon:yes stop_codon:yes gene_type:complete